MAKTDVVKKITFPAVVIDLKKRHWGVEYLDDGIGSGLIWRYEGRPMHWMVRDINGNITPVQPPDKPEVLPEDLYEALHWPECKTLFRIEPTLMEKMNFYGMFLLIGGLFILAFILIMEVVG